MAEADPQNTAAMVGFDIPEDPENIPQLSLEDLSVKITPPSVQEGNGTDADDEGEFRGMDEEARARYELYLQSKTDNFIRMDITANMLRQWSDWQRADFIQALPDNKVVKTVHLSGHGMVPSILSAAQLETLIVNGIAYIENLQELFIFRGGCITEDSVAKCLQTAIGVKLLMLWQFQEFSPNLAASIRMHPSLERLTINIPSFAQQSPKKLEYGSFDLFAMAMAGMPNLRVLQIRCDTKSRQRESIISPEAMTVLMNSNSIQSLYLENVGLLDEHVDSIADELTLINNSVLTSLDLKDNMFSEDVLYTFGHMLPKNDTLQFLDLSGANITDAGGEALAAGIINKNFTLLHLDLETVNEDVLHGFDGTFSDGYNQKEWMQGIKNQLRINRAYHSAIVGDISTSKISTSTDDFMSKRKRVAVVTTELNNQKKKAVPLTNLVELHEAVSYVHAHLGCIYYFIRTHHKLLSHMKPPVDDENKFVSICL